ncbi:unnamed protein product [Bursaphelenchus xylophilus]|uniref:HEAT repeat-containing protein 1 n=1 Tax=Bursaphelenchus xylophilus TaxID=6326 RepID=A0A1I7SWT6_BURXY|nr:unnamed protein product [Bursaphelenchus xylophilus]CAG9099904.1 unnamed protein product [Bursaphelenchus xylophilus]
MPSLQDQLRTLKTPVSKQLGVEKSTDSLLFDRKEAASFTSEEYFNLGLLGLQRLRKLDRTLADAEYDLFHPSKVSFNRATITADQNDELDKKLKSLLVHICPYFHHQSCRQVLEWLIYKYQVHLYNADLIANLFLLYHSTNSFGRLLSILNLNKNDWSFCSDFALKGLPIPFEFLVKACLRSGSSLISSLSASLTEAVQLVGENYVSEKMQMHFTFFASVIVHLFADPAHITEELISRIIPFVGIALKSRVLPFKTAGYIIVCDLCMNATLNEEVLHNILTLCMTKMRSTWFEMAMNTVFVISQNQKLTTLPARTTVKLLKRCEENDDINLQEFFSTAIAKLDISCFIVAFSRTMCSYLAESNPDEETKDLILTYLEALLDLENMTQSTAHGFLDAILQSFTSKDDVIIPQRLCPLIKNVVIRFSNVFDQFRAQNHLTESHILEKLMEQCKIAEHEVGVLDFTENKKKRRRRTSSMRILEEDPTVSFGPGSAPKITKKDQMEALQDGNEIKRMFKKPISHILEMLTKDEIDVKDVEWALQSLNDDSYLSKQTTKDLNDFWVDVVTFISKDPKSELRKSIKLGLVKVNISEKNVVSLLSRHQSNPKKQKLDKSLTEEKFQNETDAEFGERILFVLEALLASIVIEPTKTIIRRIFKLIDISQATEKMIEPLKNVIQVQQICFSYLVKSLRHSEVLDAIEQECQAEVLINIIRFGHDVNVLRNALKILTAVAPRMPTKLTSQVMSLFAFMGQGLLKKDNEMTLSIVEESLSSLVSAVLQPLNKGSLELKKQLLAISRIFAKSLHDIPIHRRLKVVKVIGTCVDSEDLWVVFAAIYEDFCLNWVRGTARDWEEELDYLSLDLMGSLPPEHQIQVCIDLLGYIVGLGGDDAKGRTSNQDGLKVFDGSNQPLKKLRHYRYIMIGFVAKSVSQQALFEELSNLTDDEIYERTAKVGIRMLEVISSLDDFVLKELNVAEKAEQNARGKESAPAAIQTLKYWIALSARAEVIADKMRCMLPANVSGHIICDLLDNKSASSKMRDRALQLLNVKLLSETGKENEEKTDKFDTYLVKFAKLLSRWIKPAKKIDDVALCQKAAFSLKLLAKRVVSDEVRPTFVEVLKRSSDMLVKWEEQDDSMIGNILLLVAEIVRSGLVSSAVLENCDSISQTCLAILKKCNISNEQSRPAEENSAMAKRVRHRAHSMSGRQFGDDVVFVCALTLVLRLLDHENEGSQSYHEDFLVNVSELSTKYIPVLERLKEGDGEDLKLETASQKTSSIRHRLQQLNACFSGMNLEKLQECLNGAVKKVYENTECLATLGLLLEEAIKKNENNDKIGSLSVEFLPVVIDLIEVRKNTKHTEENLEALKLAETAAIRAFISLTENLSESELTPVFGEFADWVEEGFNSNEPNIKYRVSTVYFLANKFYDYYNTLALPYFNRLFSYVPKLMRLLNVAKTSKDELFIDGSSKGSVEGIVAHELIIRLVQFVTNCAKHRVFIGEDRAEVVHECILDELENRKVRGHEQRCVNYLIDCIYYISESSPDLFSTSICHKLLEKLRHSNGRIRHRSLVVFDRVANRAGDAMAPLLPVVVQALTEVLEDNDQKVADQCDRTIRMLKGVFGEEILQN